MNVGQRLISDPFGSTRTTPQPLVHPARRRIGIRSNYDLTPPPRDRDVARGRIVPTCAFGLEEIEPENELRRMITKFRAVWMLAEAASRSVFGQSAASGCAFD